MVMAGRVVVIDRAGLNELVRHCRWLERGAGQWSEVQVQRVLERIDARHRAQL